MSVTIETITLEDISEAAARFRDKAVKFENDTRRLLGKEVPMSGMAGNRGNVTYATALEDLESSKLRAEKAEEENLTIRKTLNFEHGKRLEEAVLIINTMG